MDRPLHALVLTLLVVLPGAIWAAEAPVPITNGDFSQGVDAKGVPIGWTPYGGGKGVSTTVAPEGKAIIIDDQDVVLETGVTQTFDVKPEMAYEVRVKVRGFTDRPTAGAHVQFRFSPSGQFTQESLATENYTDWDEVTVQGFAPAGTKTATIYLYTHRDPTPKVMVSDVRVVSGVEMAAAAVPPPPPVPPVYDRLKDLHVKIPLVAAGKAQISIVAPERYTAAAKAIQQAVDKACGVKIPIISDTDPAAAVPLSGNLIILGNRSTNAASSKLYDNYYSLMDLKYPGPGGFALRSLHNPYGNGFSAILVGGSDDKGVAAAAEALCGILAKQAPGRDLSVGWLMETKLGEGVKLPTDLREFETWEASKGYGSVGYFGWNSISKRMAMYYMTGDPFHAREVIRLSFPDAQALKEIDAIDQERIENKQDPLAGPYHYNAMMLILYWDLIEESPVFTDGERLKVTNAFSRRLDHPQDKGTYNLNGVPSAVGSRHGQWSALSLFTLGRYFNKYYPSDLWAHAEKAGKLHFASLHKHAWVHGEADNLFWYCTGTAPILTYMVLTGDRKPLENGVLETLLKGQEALISGRVPDWALNSAALDFLLKAAYLTGDGRWLTYLNRTGMDTDIFRLGQSFWPDDSIQPQMPLDLVGKWTINAMPKPMWQGRGTGFKLSESILFGSYRSAADASGDFILLDGMNGASRNPYHTFDVLEYRLNGRTLLQGYMNQVLTSADGMVEPKVPMDGALLHHDVLGGTAVAVGEVPNMPFASWRRTIVHRTGQYGIIADDITFRADSDNMKVATQWQMPSGAWNADEQAMRVQAPGSAVNLPGWVMFRALEAKCRTNPPEAARLALLDTLGAVLLRGREPGQWLEMPFTVANEISGEMFADLVGYVDRGIARFSLDGKRVGEDFDNWAEGVQDMRTSLGQVTLKPGEHVLRVEVVGPHPGVELMNIALSGISIKSAQAAELGTTSYFEMRPSQPMAHTAAGGFSTLTWQGKAAAGDHRRVFTLFGQGTADAAPLQCLQIAPNAAVIATPAPGLVSLGDYAANKADLALVSDGHLYAHGATSAGLKTPLVEATEAVDADWDLSAGKLNIVNAKDAQVRVKLPADVKLQLGGKPLATRLTGDMVTFDLASGRHEITGATAAADAAELHALLAEGRKQRETALAALNAPPVLAGQPWQPQMQAKVGARVAAIETVNSSQGPLLAVAADNIIHLLTPDGQAVRRLETDGKIRNLRWWDKPRLLLAGCVDEKLIAFDEQGQRKWTFISEMDPAVYEAAKQYWFKSAPGHEGIHGLSTGVFLNGEEQAFVGGACTLEIVDEQGKLVKRMPLFWGPGSVFQLMPRADGSIELLVAREPTDGHYLYAVNNTDLSARRAFHTVPSGHTYVSGWANMSRDHIFHVDIDGDGTKEIVSEINGAWNRVTVWDEEGNAKCNAQFGPGSNIPARNMRDLDLMDLNGDGKLEIITATSAGLVVALDNQCHTIWSVQLASPGTVLKTITAKGAPAIVVGCENGNVLQLDAKGQTVLRGQVDGAPNKITAVTAGGKSQVVLTTVKGAVAGFAY